MLSLFSQSVCSGLVCCVLCCVLFDCNCQFVSALCLGCELLQHGRRQTTFVVSRQADSTTVCQFSVSCGYLLLPSALGRMVPLYIAKRDPSPVLHLVGNGGHCCWFCHAVSADLSLLPYLIKTDRFRLPVCSPSLLACYIALTGAQCRYHYQHYQNHRQQNQNQQQQKGQQQYCHRKQ